MLTYEKVTLVLAAGPPMPIRSGQLNTAGRMGTVRPGQLLQPAPNMLNNWIGMLVFVIRVAAHFIPVAHMVNTP